MAIRNGRRLQRMVNQLLDFKSRRRANFVYISTSDCNAFGKIFADYFEPAAVGKGVAFTVGVPEEPAPPHFCGC